MLDAFEGQALRLTVEVIQQSAENSPGGIDQSPSDEPPEWMDVEKDIYVKMPRKTKILKVVEIVEGGPLQPCIILPDPLPDD